MKRFLLFVLLVAGASSACKKSKKEAPVTPETLQGTWGEQLTTLTSNPLPVYYIFRGDSTFTKHSGGFVGTQSGTYSTIPADSTGRALQMIFTTRGVVWDTLLVKIASANRLVITSKGGSPRDFLRSQP
jgi:hypothetical protein